MKKLSAVAAGQFLIIKWNRLKNLAKSARKSRSHGYGDPAFLHVAFSQPFLTTKTAVQLSYIL
jgi:hypothetical protein